MRWSDYFSFRTNKIEWICIVMVLSDVAVGIKLSG